MTKYHLWYPFAHQVPALRMVMARDGVSWEWIQTGTLHFYPQGEGAALALVRITEP